MSERLVVGDAGKEYHFLRIDISHVTFREDRQSCVISYSGEEKILS